MCAAVIPACATDEVESIIPNGTAVVAYDPHTNYMAEMIECAENGSEYALYIGGIYETQRNMKVSSLNDDALTKTYYFTSSDPDVVRENMGISEPKVEYTKYYTDEDVLMLARVMFLEARGIQSKTELSCIAWTILNRVDNGKYGASIHDVVTAPNQFAYSPYAPTTNDYGVELAVLAQDVLERWSREKNGEVDVGRTLPSDYLWYAGDGKHNYFRNAYSGGVRWNYSLPSPYEN